jgi:hypothetical protein
LSKDWQLFSSLKNFEILGGMWQAGERIFVALLQRRQKYEAKKKVERTIAPCTCFPVTFRGMKPNNGCLVGVIVSEVQVGEGVTPASVMQTVPKGRA